MKLIATLVLALTGITIVGAAGGSGEPEPRPGLQVVYDRISAMTDCDELQAQFDQAAENHDRDSNRRPKRLDLMKMSSSYMDAADARMRQIGCY